MEPPEPAAITETRLLHKMHRAATSLLADAAQRGNAPPAALAELRDFLVAALRHHHESEDDVLWPQLISADPEAGAGLTDLSAEHNALDAALDTLAVLPVQDDDDRVRLAIGAAIVRDLVHKHLEHEEPALFPVLAANISDQAWTDFSRAVIASAPPVAAYLNVGFFELVGSPAELAMVMANLPQAALQFVPHMREQARATLSSLQATDRGRAII